MDDTQRQLLKLMIGAKGVPSPLADMALDVVDSAQGALDAYIEQTRAQTLLAYAQIGVNFASMEGMEAAGFALLHGVQRMIADEFEVEQPPTSVGATSD